VGLTLFWASGATALSSSEKRGATSNSATGELSSTSMKQACAGGGREGEDRRGRRGGTERRWEKGPMKNSLRCMQSQQPADVE